MKSLQYINNRIYQLKQGIINLIVWFPIIWNDRQWDNSYLYKILIKKIELKERFFLSNESHTLNSDQVAKQLSQVKQALIRLYDEDYLAADEFIDVEKGIIDYLAWGIEEEKLIQEDLEFVFESMKKNLRNWWD